MGNYGNVSIDIVMKVSNFSCDDFFIQKHATEKKKKDWRRGTSYACALIIAAAMFSWEDISILRVFVVFHEDFAHVIAY